MVRVVVCGSRDFWDFRVIVRDMEALQPGRDIVAHGGCPSGADRIAHCYGTWRGIEVVVFEPEWSIYGKSAGPRRNQRMLELFGPDAVWAYKMSGQANKGTDDCMTRAQKLLITTIVTEIS